MSTTDIPRKKGTAVGVFYHGRAALAEFHWGQVIIVAADMDVLDRAYDRLCGHDLDAAMATEVAIFQRSDVKELRP